MSSMITGTAFCHSFYDLVGIVYQQGPIENNTNSCMQSTENLQSFNELREIGNVAWEYLINYPPVNSKKLGAAFRIAGWNNPVAYPSYEEQDYWVHRTGEEEKYLHTEAGTSWVTLVNDTQNKTVDIVNAIWKDNVIRYYISLYEEVGTGKQDY